MPTIVDMRPPANTFRHVTSIVIWLVVCLVGLGGCKSNLVKETCIDKPVWTTVVAKDCYTETALMITVVIAFVAALIAMLLTIWDCDFKWVKIFLSIAAISTIGMIIVVTIKVMMSV